MSAPLDRRLPDYQGKNFAPVKPFTKLEERQGDKSPLAQHYITDAIKKKYEEKAKHNETSWREMILAGQLTALFIEGKQLIGYNPYSKQYTVTPASKTNPSKIKAINNMQYFATNWQAKWGSSNPDIIVEALSNADQEISRARKANALVNHLERDMYDVWYNYHEGLMAQVFGWYGMRVRPCLESGRTVMRPRVEDVPVEIGKGYWKCHDCEESGSGPAGSMQISQGAEMPTCPNCDSTAVYIEPPVQQIIPQVTGEEPFKLPRIISEQLPFPACRWDSRYRMEDSSWFLYEQELPENAVRRALGNIRLLQGESFNTLGLDVVREMAAFGASMAGRGGEHNDRQGEGGMVPVSELYLSADDLWDIEIKGDEETFAGINLPTGQRFSEVFPDGACFVGVNGFSLLTGIFAEHHSDTHTSGVYHMKPMSGTGRGVIDAVELQKRFNKLDSQSLRHMEAQSTPATLHAEGSIDENHRKLLGTPGVDIPVKMQNFPEKSKIADLVQPLQGSPVGGDMLQYTYQHLNNFMQLAYHITNFSGGLNPRVRNDTATGAEILDANAEEVFMPIMATKADTRLKNVRKAFELWCRNNPQRQAVPLKSPSRGGSRVIEISGEDVRGEYNWKVVPGSEMPKNRLSKRRDLMSFYGLFGGAPGYFEVKATGMFNKEIAEAERTFDMDFATNDYDDLGELCRARLEHARTLLQQTAAVREQVAQQYGVEVPPADPMLILPEVLPSMVVTELRHEEKIEWFGNLLDTTEGIEMSTEERMLVSAFVQGHMMLAQGQQLAVQTAANEVAVAAQQPIQQNQLAMEQQQGAMEQEKEAASAQREQQMAAQSAPDEDAAFGREMLTQGAAFEQEKELESMRHENALELEKTRAAARPRPGAK